MAVLDGSASTARVPFQATVLGIAPAYSALAGSPALSPVPANFSAPAISGLNVTYFGMPCLAEWSSDWLHYSCLQLLCQLSRYVECVFAQLVKLQKQHMSLQRRVHWQGI